MAGRTRRTRGIILGRTKLSEQDLILTMLDQGGSQVRAVAKGARKPGGRFAARTELFCETDFLLAKGRSLDIVSEAATVNAHARLRGDLERVSAASAVCEAARLTSFEDVGDPFLYAILSRTLAACEQADTQPRLDLVVAAYVFKVLAHAGWRPELRSCIACGDPDYSRFSVAAGGVLCESCAREIEGAEPITKAQVAWIAAILGSTFDQILAAEVDAETSTYLLSLSHLWAATHLDARLRAFEFLLSV